MQTGGVRPSAECSSVSVSVYLGFSLMSFLHTLVSYARWRAAHLVVGVAVVRAVVVVVVVGDEARDDLVQPDVRREDAAGLHFTRSRQPTTSDLPLRACRASMRCRQSSRAAVPHGAGVRCDRRRVRRTMFRKSDR